MEKDDNLCWCGHILADHDLEKGTCKSCPPCSDGGCNSNEEYLEHVKDCEKNKSIPYMFWSESWCYRFKPKWICDGERKQKEDERGRRGEDMVTCGDAIGFEDWWKKEGRSYTREIYGIKEYWYKDENLRTAIKRVMSKAWKIARPMCWICHKPILTEEIHVQKDGNPNHSHDECLLNYKRRS